MGCSFIPAIAVVVHYFKRRRALATGIVLSGGGIGSVVFPISSYIHFLLLSIDNDQINFFSAEVRKTVS